MTRAVLALLAWAALGGCAATAPVASTSVPTPGPNRSAPSRLVTLANAGFEAEMSASARCPARWGCRSHADPGSHRFVLDETAPAGGKRSLCIERVRPEPWALATQALHDATLRGARVRFSLAVRVEAASEGAGPWILVHRRSGDNLHEQRLSRSTDGWQRMEIELTVPADAEMVEVGATLEGSGRACIDDARLEVLQENKNPV